MVLRNLTQKEFSCIWGSKWVGVIGIEIERTQIHFLSDVFVAVAVCYKDLASDPSGYCLGCIHEFRKLFYKCIVIFSSVSETLVFFGLSFLRFHPFCGQISEKKIRRWTKQKIISQSMRATTTIITLIIPKANVNSVIISEWRGYWNTLTSECFKFYSGSKGYFAWSSYNGSAETSLSL